MLRDAVTRPPARPGANAGARSSTRPPWAPTPGSRNVACPISSRARCRCRGAVAPTTAPTSLRPGLAHPRAAQRVHDRRHPLPQRAPALQRRHPRRPPRPGWRSARAPARPRRRRAPPTRTARSQSPPISGLTVTRSAPRPSTRPKRRLDAAQQRLGVRGGAHRDIPPLAVGDHQQAALPRVGGDRRQSAPAPAPRAARSTPAAA